MSQKSAKRILNDIKHYNKSNLNENGIHVLFNEDNIYNCKALIIGPKDTPYCVETTSSILTFLKIILSKIDFCTLDPRVRFNPNYIKTARCVYL